MAIWYNKYKVEQPTLIEWSGGGCSDTYRKGVFNMDLNLIINIIELIIILEIIKNIKK